MQSTSALGHQHSGGQNKHEPQETTTSISATIWYVLFPVPRTAKQVIAGEKPNRGVRGGSRHLDIHVCSFFKDKESENFEASVCGRHMQRSASIVVPPVMCDVARISE